MTNPIRVRNAISALRSKGFREERDSHHVYMRYVRDGKQERFYTCFSHGSYEFDGSLLRTIARQLGLDTNKEAKQLLLCPMSEAAYQATLKARGRL